MKYTPDKCPYRGEKVPEGIFSQKQDGRLHYQCQCENSFEILRTEEAEKEYLQCPTCKRTELECNLLNHTLHCKNCGEVWYSKKHYSVVSKDKDVDQEKILSASLLI